MILALGQWHIDTQTITIYEQDNHNQPIDLGKEAIQLLIILAKYQNKLVDKPTLIKNLWPLSTSSSQYEQQFDSLVHCIQHQLDKNVLTITPNNFYLLQTPTFTYQYTPITPAQMKQQLVKKQSVTTQSTLPSRPHTKQRLSFIPRHYDRKITSLILLIIFICIYISIN